METPFDIPFADFVGRIHITHDTVRFSQADPYNHLASAQYLNLVFDHRIEGIRDQIKFDVLYLLKARKLAFFLRETRMLFLAPAAVGDALEITTWVRAFSERDCEVRALVIGRKDRVARAAVTMSFIFVNVETNRPVPVPASLPSHATENLILTMPEVAPYLDGVKNLPSDWKAQATASPRPPATDTPA